MEIEQSVWGMTPEGEAVILYTMRNALGASVQLTNIGAAVVSVVVPDRTGAMGDVVTGYLNYSDYLDDAAAAGTLVRTNGVLWQDRIWQSRVETDRVVFSLMRANTNRDPSQETEVEVVYDWDDDNVLEVTMFAASNAPVTIDITSWVCPELAGAGTVEVNSTRTAPKALDPQDIYEEHVTYRFGVQA